MTLEEFNSPIWTGGMKARFRDSIFDVTSVDFEEKKVWLDIGDDSMGFPISYKEGEIVKPSKEG